MKEDVKYAFEIKNIKGLRQLERDINAWVKSLSASDQAELSKILSQIQDTASVKKKTTENVLKRRSIVNDEEYRLIHDYVQDLCESDGLYHKFTDLEAILSEYDKNRLSS